MKWDYINHFFGSPSVLVCLCALRHPILIFFAIDSLMNCLTGETIGLSTHGATEHVDIVVADDGPTCAVSGLTVNGSFLHRLLSKAHRTGQMPLKNLITHQLRDSMILIHSLVH